MSIKERMSVSVPGYSTREGPYLVIASCWQGLRVSCGYHMAFVAIPSGCLINDRCFSLQQQILERNHLKEENLISLQGFRGFHVDLLSFHTSGSMHNGSD